jgi:hypothetical protein
MEEQQFIKDDKKEVFLLLRTEFWMGRKTFKK